MNEQEIKTRFEAIENRLNDLESRKEKLAEIKPQEVKINFSGLAGGIRLLIENGFLSFPKDFKEIKEELKREGYHYSDAGIMSTLAETFVKNKKTLTRIKEGKMWKYVIRK